MKYVVDARLEKGQPRLRVLDADTGVVHMEWSLTRVNQMLDEGVIDPNDFLHPERYGMRLLLKNLFLLSCVESMASKESKRQSKCVNIKQSYHLQNSKDSEWQFDINVKPI